jgi:hypothetical protein
MQVVDIQFDKLIQNAKDFGLVERIENKMIIRKKETDGKSKVEKYTPFIALT